MIWNLYLSVRSDHREGWGSFVLKIGFLLLLNSLTWCRTCNFWSELTPVKGGGWNIFFWKLAFNWFSLALDEVELYLSVRSDPVKGGAVFFWKLAFYCFSIALHGVELVFLARSDPCEGWGLEYFLKNGF